MTNKAKRKIHKFNFDTEGAAVALVGPVVGGAANGYTTLLTKSTANISEEFLKKYSKVTVTMDIAEYLRKFFGLYWDDAEVLARVLGYTTKEQEDNTDDYWVNYIDEKVSSVSIMKHLFKADDINEAISKLQESALEQLLNDQVMIEKAMSSFKPEDVNSDENVTSKNEDVTNVSKEEQLDKSVEELITKAVANAVADVKKELTDAQEIIKNYQTKEVELNKAARKEALKDAIKVEEHVEDIFKALEKAEDGEFAKAIVALTAITKAVDSSELFEEQGVDTGAEEKSVADDYTMKIMKAKFNKA